MLWHFPDHHGCVVVVALADGVGLVVHCDKAGGVEGKDHLVIVLPRQQTQTQGGVLDMVLAVSVQVEAQLDLVTGGASVDHRTEVLPGHAHARVELDLPVDAASHVPLHEILGDLARLLGVGGDQGAEGVRLTEQCVDLPLKVLDRLVLAHNLLHQHNHVHFTVAGVFIQLAPLRLKSASELLEDAADLDLGT